MKYVVQILAGCGIAAFLVGVAMRFAGTDLLFHAAAVGWWRVSVFFIGVSILYTLVQIRDELRKQ